MARDCLPPGWSWHSPRAWELVPHDAERGQHGAVTVHPHQEPVPRVEPPAAAAQRIPKDLVGHSHSQMSQLSTVSSRTLDIGRG